MYDIPQQNDIRHDLERIDNMIAEETMKESPNGSAVTNLLFTKLMKGMELQACPDFDAWSF